MSVLNIQEPQDNSRFSLFVLGFRPFFIGAGVFSIITMGMWIVIYQFGLALPFDGLTPFQWHAHEMIYGYLFAVVSGFLLTAIKNWTGVQTLQYGGLIALTALWTGARVCMLFGTGLILYAAVFDLLFNIFLIIALLKPVWRVKQWKQIGIISKIILLAGFNLLFYMGMYDLLEQGVYWGIYGGFFMLAALVMVMGRRVMPFFIERGVGYQVKLNNSKFLDISNLFVFLAFAIIEVFFRDSELASYFAAGLFIISLIRLYNWHTHGIWKAPLLWGLYGAFVFFSIGFLLFALLPYTQLYTHSIAIHALALGGMGLITLSMMSRVSLGHTGRNVHQASPWIGVAQWLILFGALSRVFLPMVFPEHYGQWIFSAQVLWISGFILFIIVNIPMLVRPDVRTPPG